MITNRQPARLRGVYYLFLGDVVIYVGSSVNILMRVGQQEMYEIAASSFALQLSATVDMTNLV